MPTERQRREAERRRLQRQLERRREREIRRRRLTLITSVAGTVLVAAVIIGFVIATSGEGSKSAAGGKSATSTSVAATSPSPSPTASVAAYPCTWTKSGTAAKKVLVPPMTSPSRSGTVDVRLTTTRGPVTLTLNRRIAPCAVESFVSLTAQKYFDSTPCHRLTSSASLKVLQCGDPTGTGSGGPGYTFADELTGSESYARGVVAMANAGANTNGSQFFLVYGNSRLSPSYTIFGHVTKGLSVLDAVAAKGSTPATNGKPKLPISITKASVG